jgi:hypothetical protein
VGGQPKLVSHSQLSEDVEVPALKIRVEMGICLVEED